MKKKCNCQRCQSKRKALGKLKEIKKRAKYLASLRLFVTSYYDRVKYALLLTLVFMPSLAIWHPWANVFKVMATIALMLFSLQLVYIASEQYFKMKATILKRDLMRLRSIGNVSSLTDMISKAVEAASLSMVGATRAGMALSDVMDKFNHEKEDELNKILKNYVGVESFTVEFIFSTLMPVFSIKDIERLIQETGVKNVSNNLDEILEKGREGRNIIDIINDMNIKLYGVSVESPLIDSEIIKHDTIVDAFKRENITEDQAKSFIFDITNNTPLDLNNIIVLISGLNPRRIFENKEYIIERSKAGFRMHEILWDLKAKYDEEKANLVKYEAVVNSFTLGDNDIEPVNAQGCVDRLLDKTGLDLDDIASILFGLTPKTVMGYCENIILEAKAGRTVTGIINTIREMVNEAAKENEAN